MIWQVGEATGTFDRVGELDEFQFAHALRNMRIDAKIAELRGKNVREEAIEEAVEMVMEEW